MIDERKIAEDVILLCEKALNKKANLAEVTEIMGVIEKQHPEQLRWAIHMLMHYVTDSDVMQKDKSHEEEMKLSLNKALGELKAFYSM